MVRKFFLGAVGTLAFIAGLSAFGLAFVGTFALMGYWCLAFWLVLFVIFGGIMSILTNDC